MVINLNDNDISLAQHMMATKLQLFQLGILVYPYLPKHTGKDWIPILDKKELELQPSGMEN